MPDAPPAIAPFIHTQGLTFAYPHATSSAVQNVSLSLSSGELLAIVGPNGCGKSTLLRLLCGQLLPTGGTITLNNSPLSSLNPAKIAHHIALVPQHTSAGFPYSVREMVLMARWATHNQTTSGPKIGLSSALGFETEEDHALANQAMWTADVHHLADRPIHDLSGGERQRVIIARALAQQTPAIFLDEPTSALDLYHQLELLHHLRDLTRAAAHARAILIITHDLNLALQFSDRAILMDAGRIVAEGSPQSVLTPTHLDPVYRVTTQVGSSALLSFTRNI